MPDPNRPGDRTAKQRQADHAGLARLSDTLVPALVQKLNGSGLGELEVREGDWRIRLRRPTGAAAPARRERPRPGAHAPAAHATPRPAPPEAPHDPNRAAATSPTVGVFRAVAATGTRVRQGDRIAVVDLLGIPQDVAAPVDGILVELLVESGEAVEYGEAVAIVAESSAADRTGGDGSDGTGGEV
jgi:acetyl-CoA carboxylase biotin carboxyl carrier protein